MHHIHQFRPRPSRAPPPPVVGLSHPVRRSTSSLLTSDTAASSGVGQVTAPAERLTLATWAGASVRPADPFVSSSPCSWSPSSCETAFRPRMLSFRLLRIIASSETVMSRGEIKALLGGWGCKQSHSDKDTVGPCARPSWLLAENHESLVVLDHL